MLATHQYILQGKALPCPYNLSYSFFIRISNLIIFLTAIF
ncbi:hypothetical protein FDUTEX481_03832 [Tolypothrix sp. PCC 7601]|nr:hypothetical protein FDUTEX481_03832 [Tolypothrix sp. PCC 7601]